MVTLASESVFSDLQTEEDEEIETAESPAKMFKEIHDSKYFWADTYAMFERILDLGIKELYFRDDGLEQQSNIVAESK